MSLVDPRSPFAFKVLVSGVFTHKLPHLSNPGSKFAKNDTPYDFEATWRYVVRNNCKTMCGTLLSLRRGTDLIDDISLFYNHYLGASRLKFTAAIIGTTRKLVTSYFITAGRSLTVHICRIRCRPSSHPLHPTTDSEIPRLYNKDVLFTMVHLMPTRP